MSGDTTYVWAELRDAFALRVGDAPGAQIEQQFLDAFDQHPELVAEALDYVAERHARGLVRSPWPVARLHVSALVDTAQRAASATAQGGGDKRARVQRAQAWIRAAGIHFDRESELVDELFDSPGAMLKAYASDDELREQMAALWREVRPAGERVEREELERAQMWVAARQREREERAVMFARGFAKYPAETQAWAIARGWGPEGQSEPTTPDKPHTPSPKPDPIPPPQPVPPIRQYAFAGASRNPFLDDE